MDLPLALTLVILQINPNLQPAVAEQYVEILIDEAEQKKLDPWLFAGLVWVESRWTLTAFRKEKVGGCSVGLGQIYLKDCKNDDVFAYYDARANLHRAAIILSDARRICSAWRRQGKECWSGGWIGGYNPGNSAYAEMVRRAANKYRALAARESTLRAIQARVYPPDV